MSERNSLIAVLLISMLNGIFSPYVILVFLSYGVWYPFFLPAIPQAVYFASSLILSTLTVMASGIPAALYESRAGRGISGKAGLIWVGAAFLLTLPAMPNMMRVLAAGSA
jgi:hypothetical protein